MSRNLKQFKNKKQASYMTFGLPNMTVYNAVDWTTHTGMDVFFKEVSSSDRLQDKTRKIEKIVAEQLTDFSKPVKPGREPKKIGENYAILVTPAQNQYGMMFQVCTIDIAEQRYEKSVKQQGKKLPFVGTTFQIAA